jgi:SAM-dependent methyltransferase
MTMASRRDRLPSHPGAAAYGDAIADIYDELHAYIGDATDAVNVLAELAGPRGRALELGIGTGRLALPLAARGVEVHGIDVSERMIATLRGKPGGADIDVSTGDFADVDVVGTFNVIYVCFNTFFGLTTLDAQQRCFNRVAAHLAPGGRFVVEAFVPRYRERHTVKVHDPVASPGSYAITRHEPASHRVSTTEILVRDGTIRVYPIELRYATVVELDLMACLAGMRLGERWSSWRRTPFGPHSADHVSVYGA